MIKFCVRIHAVVVAEDLDEAFSKIGTYYTSLSSGDSPESIYESGVAEIKPFTDGS